MSDIHDYRTIGPDAGGLAMYGFLSLGELRAFVDHLSFLPDEWPIECKTLRARVPYPHEGLDLAAWLRDHIEWRRP